MMEVKCTNEEKVHFTVKPVTEAGHPVALDGAISVSVQSGDGTVELDGPDAFWIISGDQIGDTSVLVSGDADLGEGAVTISDIVILHVEGPMAKNLGITAEPPVLK